MEKVTLLVFSLMLLLEAILLIITPVGATQSAWSTKTPMPTARSNFGIAVVNEKIYAIGGAPGFAANEMYDPVTDEWTSRASMPTQRFSFAIAVVNDKIYVFGGQSGYNMSGSGEPILCPSTEVYDPATDSWQSRKPMPMPRTQLNANEVNGLVYLIGGLPGNGSTYASNLNQVYDPESDSWTLAAPISAPAGVYGYGSAVVGDKIFILGGGVSGNSNYSNMIYSASTDSWTKGAPIPSSDITSAAATIGLNTPRRIYVLGGGWLFGSTLNQIYDVENNTWSFGSPLPTARYGLGLAIVNGILYAIGGGHNGDITGQNEQYSPWLDISSTSLSTSAFSPTPEIPEFPVTTVIIVLALMVTTVVKFTCKRK